MSSISAIASLPLPAVPAITPSGSRKPDTDGDEATESAASKTTEASSGKTLDIIA